MLQISTLGQILISVFILSLIIPVFVGAYLVLNFLHAPKRFKKSNFDHKPKTKFVVVIPARNEEKVISSTIESLRKISYPLDLYDLIVVADNCTDKTAFLAKKSGAKVFVRNDLTKRSKAHALKWLFENEKFINSNYDAVCILDADTVLEKDFLLVMDKEISDGHEIIQGRLGSINPYESFTSGFMTVLASVENRLWYLPQATRKRSGFYIGTGACITFDRIKKTGWNINTLVEDAEFSIQSVLMGGFVRYCDNARYYVEQVNDLKQLWKQQRRWRTGQLDCLKRYFKPLIKNVFKDGNKNSISLLILVLIPVMCMSFILQTIITPFIFGELFGYTIFDPIMIIIGMILNIVFMFSLYSFILWMDGIFSIRLWKGILAVIFSPIFYGIVDFASLISPIKEWNPIKHGHSKWYIKGDDFKRLSEKLKNSKKFKKFAMIIKNEKFDN